ncbi:MAG: formylmethanofuran dehydrogenase subunit C [Candidatus Thorarchaeota archaeon]
MKSILLKLKEPIEKPTIPIEAENISPDVFANKTLETIKQLSIWRGNKEIRLDEVFEITGDSLLEISAQDIAIELQGNLAKFKRIGQKMTAGIIKINGSVGMHLGEQMEGGKIIVEGDVHDFAGANMKDGEIHIKGNAGHYLGGSVRGEWRGMSGGRILVEGNVKNECGVWMRNGIIEIKGNATMFTGMHMHRGIIIVHGDIEERAGAEMTGGIIVICGKLHKNLPSFEYVKEITGIELEGYGKLPDTFYEFHGDFAEKKQGVMYVKTLQNNHLIADY